MLIYDYILCITFHIKVYFFIIFSICILILATNFVKRRFRKMKYLWKIFIDRNAVRSNERSKGSLKV